MNDKRLKQLEEWTNCENSRSLPVAKNVSDLIKYVRQLEKEAKEDECPYCNIIAIQSKTIGELLAALKNIELDAHSGVTYGKMEKALIEIAKSANQAYNKHKGE